MSMGLFTSDEVLSYEFTDWEHGAAGFELALMDAEEDEKPLILYFHTDTISWCEKMNNDYFAVFEIEEFIGGILKAEMDPGQGGPEKELADRYGVKEYPTLLVYIPAFKGKPERIHPFQKDRSMTANEFLKILRDKIVYQYNKKGFSCSEKKDYKNALKYFEMALDYDPESAYTYFAMGTVYHFMGSSNKDLESMKKAEANYLKALEIDPKHKESRAELKKVRKDMGKTGSR